MKKTAAQRGCSWLTYNPNCARAPLWDKLHCASAVSSSAGVLPVQPIAGKLCYCDSQ